MSKTQTLTLLTLMLCVLSVGCQNQPSTPTGSGVTKILIEGTSIQFFQEPALPGTAPFYLEAELRGVLTLQDNCLRVGEDGPVVIWPRIFTPHINDGVVEIHDALGQVVARVGSLIELGGGGGSSAAGRIDPGDCPGGVWHKVGPRSVREIKPPAPQHHMAPQFGSTP